VKLLFDQNISFRLIAKIQDIFPESKQVREFGLENSNDKKIWEYAKENGYSIVTFDSDFYEFSVLYEFPPKIIWLRTGNLTTPAIEKLIRANQKNIESFIEDKELSCIEING
jgi:predicted nuclease of predicted toxin-antitoxin system